MNDCNYDDDFFCWSRQQAEYLRKGEFEKLDLIHLQDEIESMGNSDKRALQSQTTRLLMHMLKEKFQPEKNFSNSWQSSIVDAKRQIKRLIKDSPSLKNELKKIFLECYEDAKEDAHLETKIEIKKFPIECPWTIEEVLK